MTSLIIIFSVALLFVVLVQIAKIYEISEELKGEEASEIASADLNSKGLLLFCVVLFGTFIWGSLYYANYMLGYGPLEAASEHGGKIDSMFNITAFFTIIVFAICHLALFYFAYKFRYRPGRKAMFLPHDDKLEMIWTGIPAFVMVILVVKGLFAWNEIMADTKSGDEYLSIEATAWQFAWNLRYPGKDGQLGVKDFRLIKPGSNDLGQDWHDERNLDDFNSDELVLPKGKKVRVSITARDVLHNFYLPHFRVKMDAVPGIPTYFVFTPTKTTEEFRQELRKYKEYNVPSDPNDPNSEPKWKTFNYELACAELCGKGHYSMRRLVKVVSPEEFEKWMASQKSQYISAIRNTDEDPFKGKKLDLELKSEAAELKNALMKALDTTNKNSSDRVLNLHNIYFETGSSKLSSESEFALSVLKEAFEKYPNLKVEIAGHTDNVGDASANLNLSRERANSVRAYLIEHSVNSERMNTTGYGMTKPVSSNDTEEGRSMNRRIEFKILSF
ncbi:MAG: OmpA family protein [Saprospiraceae bacterium]|nr:OmpA family protein [Saprospiraceae bacterium]HMW39849.1 OmpA family protein [Saprospiraceae bacterium]HMX88987.1 OmpA family protein [Saprospiraceae bacterium]HMZ40844.1 OmpA family protein [Saprospiraceae bacterium]HNA65211.1 OmpA family protein [Saprospiraceae bacterium]